MLGGKCTGTIVVLVFTVAKLLPEIFAVLLMLPQKPAELTVAWNCTVTVVPGLSVPIVTGRFRK